MSIQEADCARVGDAPRYVLGELHGAQLDNFARHLRTCETCAEEVRLLQHAAEAVPYLATPYVAPEEELVAQRRAETPTLAVAAANAREARIAAESRAEWQPPTQTGRPALRTIQGGASTSRRTGSQSSGGGRRRLLKTPVPRSALVSLVALGILAITTVAMSSTAASVRYLRIQAGWSRGGAALKLVNNKLELLVEGMPRPARGTGYEVWVVTRSHQVVPTGAWIRLNRLDQAGVNVPGNYHDWNAVAVYVEPVPGRDTIHSGAVVVGDLRGLK